MTDRIEEVRRIMAAPEEVDLPESVLRDAPPGAPPSDGPPPEPPPPEDAGPQQEGSPVELCAEMPLNDFGNGCRLVAHFGDDIRFVSRVGWHVWDARRWAPDMTAAKDLSPAVRALAQQMGPLIAQEVKFITLPPAKEMQVRKRADKEQRLADLEARRSAKEEMTATEIAEIASLKAEIKEIAEALAGVQDRIGQRLRHAKNAGNSGPLTAMLNEARVLRLVQIEELDAGALDVNTMTGLLRFSVDDGGEGCSRTARVDLVPHDRAQLLSKIMAVGYDPEARAPRFEAFLQEVQPREDVRRFLQRWFGLSMTGLQVQKLVFMHGAGANGKSVLADTVARILGDYATTAKIESLIGRNRRSGGDATPDLVPLIGARAVRASEPEEGERLQEGKIKELTGGEPILVRALNEDFIEVTPRFKLTISGNHKPDIRGTDEGIWRRVLLVPWEVQIAEERRDLQLVDKLVTTEAAGILNWLIEGLLDYLEGGLQEPDVVLDATRLFREESDPIGAFLTECTVVSGDDGDFMGPRELVDACRYWQDKLRGETPFGDRTISNRLRDKAGRWRHPKSGQCFRAHHAGTRSYRGIRLTDTFRRQFDAREHSPTQSHGDSEDRDGAF